MVHVVSANLKGKVAEWVTQLHDESARAGKCGSFLQKLWTRFKDKSQTLKAKTEIKEIKQKGHPAKEYIRVQKKCR